MVVARTLHDGEGDADRGVEADLAARAEVASGVEGQDVVTGRELPGADDTDPTERVVVANADQMMVVVALADPPPRTGLVDRALIAAYTGGLKPILCLTKTDLADPAPFAEQFADLDLIVVTAGRDQPVEPVQKLLDGHITVLLGHSGVGKSTLVNRLLPQAHRAVGVVSGVGKGKHTSTQSVALPLPGGGWVVDTPGIRSFGLAHIKADDVLKSFSDLGGQIDDCPRGCGHLGPPADPECALDLLTGDAARRVAAARRLLDVLHHQPASTTSLLPRQEER